MAQERHLQQILDDTRNSKKIHEGLATVLTPREHGFPRLYDRRMVLKGKALLLFDGNRLADAIILRSSIRVTNVVPGQPQPGFGFEIESLTSSGQTKFTYFMFKQQNDRDYWKAIILATLQGSIPRDVDLLPGQMAHIRELISQSVEFPVTTPYRNPLESRGRREERLPLPVQSHENLRSRHDEEEEDWSEEQQVYELSKRQTMLSRGMLEKEISSVARVPQLQSLHHRSSVPDALFRDHPSARPRVSTGSVQWIAPGNETMERRFPRHHVTVTNGHDHSMLHLSRNHETRRPSTRVEATDDWSYVNRNNNEVHPFYRDPASNGEKPKWFIDCNREIAEAVLTNGHRHGNLLMRPGTANCSGSQMCYALSYRGDKQQIMHFAVIRRPEGFKIDVDDEHAPMFCLLDVVEYFVNSVGPGVQPLRCNNLNEILCCKSQMSSHGLRLAVPPSLSSGFSHRPDMGHPVLAEQLSPSTIVPSLHQSPVASSPAFPVSSENLFPTSTADLLTRPLHKMSSSSEIAMESRERQLSKQNSSSSSSSGVYSPSSDQIASPLSPPPPPPLPPPPPSPSQEAVTAVKGSSSSIQRLKEIETKPSNTSDKMSKIFEKKDPQSFQNELQAKLPKFRQSTYKPSSP